ncbi:hypothetical protein [Nocardia seriolae]|nr:hypothetical protein [Nocardia seriolae]MTJ62957.1 hypothetical protein [Nocardia seriolae]MTK40890.1 hypothetical protein [Nocardia seriolae]QOW35860.1 hypothetical protein IMZ23_13665 [Nocardia seriolae]QUN16646.1 hypothetical protein KEC46_31285 [Nocardia seriolae]WKY49784.1 hypothetical protein Q5P07_22145 [Nocardia seriolae]
MAAVADGVETAASATEISGQMNLSGAEGIGWRSPGECRAERENGCCDA